MIHMSWRRILIRIGQFCVLSLVLGFASTKDVCGQEKATEAAAQTESSEGNATVEKGNDEAEEGKKKKRVKSGDESEFVRLRKDDSGEPLALETSITRYEGKQEDGTPIIVDLIGAVHVGEQEYYEALNKSFDQYDAVLYELVAPEGTRVEKGERDSGFNPISGLQKAMKNTLKLEFQLDHIDYSKKNFVHADMSPEEFLASMKENEESMMRIFFKMMGHSMGAQKNGGLGDPKLFSSMFSKDGKYVLRSMMADQLQDVDGFNSVWEGKNGSTIITHRNGKCFEVLKRELKDGKKTIGVFYGAGHLADMEQRLIKDFKLKKTDEKWLSAWMLAPASQSEE
jgi:hypothetical protein